MARKVYTKQQAQDAAEAWERWKNTVRDDGEPLGHPMPFMKVYTALMDKADCDRELLRWLFPDSPTRAKWRVADMQSTLIETLHFTDLEFSDSYVQFLLREYTQRLSGRFTQLTLREQVGRPMVEGGGPLQIDTGVVEGVVVEET